MAAVKQGENFSREVNSARLDALPHLCILHTHEVLVARLHGEVGAPHHSVIPPEGGKEGGGGRGEEMGREREGERERDGERRRGG